MRQSNLNTSPASVSDWTLERIALGESPASGPAREALSPEDRARLERLEASNAEILARYAPESVVASIERRARVLDAQEDAQRRRRRGALVGLLIPAAVAAVALWVGLSGAGDEVEDSAAAARVGSPQTAAGAVPAPTERIKGGARIVLYRRTATEPELLREGDRVRAGDTLQVRYIADGAPYGVIVSVDGNGAATLHHPARVGGDTRLEAEAGVRLDHAYELDDAPGFERFFFVTSAAPLDAGQVLEEAERLGRSGEAGSPEARLELNGLSAEASQHGVMLRKAP